MKLSLNLRQGPSAATGTQANVDLANNVYFERNWGIVNIFLFRIMIFYVTQSFYKDA